MNQAAVVNEVSNRSGEQREICEVVIKSYEKYCEHNITRTSSKHMSAIVAFVSANTGIDSLVAENVVSNLLEVVKEQLKDKVPFM